jgi:hypothetical protein
MIPKKYQFSRSEAKAHECPTKMFYFLYGAGFLFPFILSTYLSYDLSPFPFSFSYFVQGAAEDTLLSALPLVIRSLAG